MKSFSGTTNFATTAVWATKQVIGDTPTARRPLVTTIAGILGSPPVSPSVVVFHSFTFGPAPLTYPILSAYLVHPIFPQIYRRYAHAAHNSAEH